MIFFQSLDVVCQEGYVTHHVHASYVHLYFPASSGLNYASLRMLWRY